MTESSSDLALMLPSDPECPQNIETGDFFDMCALGNLQRQVNSNRINFGLRPFPEMDYRHINKASLESMMD